VLWLLLHERPELMNQAADDYQGYQEVNRLFAHKTKQVIEPDDVIWVHDYHFLSVAYHCRSLGITNRIGFFLHIPFAPLAFWQQLDQSAELIHHLAHYDVLGTQTEHDKANCLAVLQHYLNRRLLSNNPLTHVPKDILATKDSFISAYTPAVKELLIQLDIKPEHSLIVNAYPIGVNVTKIQQQVGHLWSPSLSADNRIPWSRAVRVDLNAEQLQRKTEAIACFKSQIESDTSTGNPPILSAQTIARISQPWEVYLYEPNV
jgi:trehalose 6-phosphate synthase